MREYNIRYSERSLKALKKIPIKDQKRILEKVDLLKYYPDIQSLDVIKLQGYDGVFRMRIGKYRVIFSVLEMYILIEVEEIAHRKDVYKKI